MCILKAICVRGGVSVLHIYIHTISRMRECINNNCVVALEQDEW